MQSSMRAPLGELDDQALAVLADKLAPLLADRLGRTSASDGWLRGADQIAAYIGAPRSRVYAITSARRLPIQRDGSALVAPVGIGRLAPSRRLETTVRPPINHEHTE